MLVALRSFIRLPWMDCIWIGRIAIDPVFAAVSVLAQSASGPGTLAATAAPASQTPASVATPAPCLPSPETAIPVNSTVEANVPGTLDSGHLKSGQEIWVKVVH